MSTVKQESLNYVSLHNFTQTLYGQLSWILRTCIQCDCPSTCSWLAEECSEQLLSQQGIKLCRYGFSSRPCDIHAEEDYKEFVCRGDDDCKTIFDEVK